MRHVRWDRQRYRQLELRSLEYQLLSPLRGSPRLKPRSQDERLALALAARTAVRSGNVLEFLGARRWRLLRSSGRLGGS